ncbi:MAG: metalloregulator ArsR/SmtB family transcription factor [Lachnospiraceae bacterium]|nr:metalloregulator ArsR/SmtB family transcription factor [Lachnospiraceae bacterium]
MGKNKEKKAKKAAERKEKTKTGKPKAAKNSEKPKRQVTLYPESFEKTVLPTPVPKKEPPRLPDDAFTQKMLIIFQALSDENRLKIMNLLAERERSTPELLESVNIVQSTMSHHMKVLSEAGLVQSRRAGKRSCYSVRKDTLEQAAAYFEFLRRE